MCGTAKLIILPIGIILIFIGILGLKNDEVLIEGLRKVSREKQPVLFWIHIFIYIGMGLAAILFALNPEWLIAIQASYQK